MSANKSLPTKKQQKPNGSGNATGSGGGNIPQQRSAPQGGSSSSISHQLSPADLNKIVLDYLNKKGYHQTEATLRVESTKIPGQPTFKLTPSNSNYELPTNSVSNRSNIQFQQQQFMQNQNISKQRQFDEDPKMFGRAYLMFRSWCENSLEMYKYELEKFLYPIFVHLYLSLIKRNEINEARSFYENFKNDHLLLHSYEIKNLGGISLPSHLLENQIAKIFENNKYKIIVSNTSLNLVLSFLNENEGIGGGIIVRIINKSIEINNQVEVSTKIQDENQSLKNMEGIPLIYQLINSDNSNDSNNSNNVNQFLLDNEKDLKLGPYPTDPEFTKELEAELKQRDTIQKESNNKKPEITLLEEYNQNFKTDPNNDDSPLKDSLPLPQKSIYDLKREILKIQDSRSKIKLSPVQAALPSVCMYTFHNTNNDLTSLEFNSDSTIIAGGFQDSFIKIWSIDGSPLKSVIKNDPLNETIDGLPINNTRRLIGHSGSVYGLSFSPDNHYLLSSSEDKTVKLWSMDTFTPLVSYKGHNSPVWDVKFSPLGHYFATASHDQTARLWSCDHIYPLRIFAGHLNDVDIVRFHPNSTYLFTASSDKTIRMWDISRGESVRVFIGHTTSINALECSPDGRWLVSAGDDGLIHVWDISSGRKLKTMRGHGRNSIYSLSWSMEGSVVVSGGEDGSVRVWDIKRGTADAVGGVGQPERFNGNNNNGIANNNNSSNNNSNNSNENKKEDKKNAYAHGSADHLAVYFTKRTPVYKVNFTRRNLCLAGGVFQ